MASLLTIPLVILTLTFAFGKTAWADGIDQDEAASLRQQGVILPLSDIIAAAQKQHQGRIIEVELEHKHGRYIYEIEIVNDEGKVWEIKLNASDANIISQEEED